MADNNLYYTRVRIRVQQKWLALIDPALCYSINYSLHYLNLAYVTNNDKPTCLVS